MRTVQYLRNAAAKRRNSRLDRKRASVFGMPDGGNRGVHFVVRRTSGGHVGLVEVVAT